MGRGYRGHGVPVWAGLRAVAACVCAVRNAEKIEFDWTKRRVLVHLPLSAVALEVDGDLWPIVESCCGSDAVLLPSARSSVLRFCAAADAAAWLLELAADNG